MAPKVVHDCLLKGDDKSAQKVWTGSLPVFLVLGSVEGSAVADPALKEAQVPGVDGLAVVLLARANVGPTSVNLGQGDTQRVRHEDQGQQEPAHLRYQHSLQPQHLHCTCRVRLSQLQNIW